MHSAVQRLYSLWVRMLCRDLVDFCEDVLTWMEANQDNVIVVHCKGGKGKCHTLLCNSGFHLGGRGIPKLPNSPPPQECRILNFPLPLEFFKCPSPLLSKDKNPRWTPVRIYKHSMSFMYIWLCLIEQVAPGQWYLLGWSVLGSFQAPTRVWPTSATGERTGHGGTSARGCRLPARAAMCSTMRGSSPAWLGHCHLPILWDWRKSSSLDSMVTGTIRTHTHIHVHTYTHTHIHTYLGSKVLKPDHIFLNFYPCHTP